MSVVLTKWKQNRAEGRRKERRAHTLRWENVNAVPQKRKQKGTGRPVEGWIGGEDERFRNRVNTGCQREGETKNEVRNPMGGCCLEKEFRWGELLLKRMRTKSRDEVGRVVLINPVARE